MGESRREVTAIAAGFALLVVACTAVALIGRAAPSRLLASERSNGPGRLVVGDVDVPLACDAGEAVHDEVLPLGHASTFGAPNDSSPRGAVLAHIDLYPRLNALGAPDVKPHRGVAGAVVAIRDGDRAVALLETVFQESRDWDVARLTACASWLVRVESQLECLPGETSSTTHSDFFQPFPREPGDRSPAAAAASYVGREPALLALLEAQRDEWANPVVIRKDGRVVAILGAQRLNPDRYVISNARMCASAFT